VQGAHQTMFDAMVTATWQERRDMMNRMFEAKKLQARIETQLTTIKRMPQLIRSFFKAPSVAYIADW
jgi:hypothetical protein